MTGFRKGTAGTVGLAWLAHPVTLLALAVLVVNDHVLKAVYPGWVTGKLSDAAGMVVAPALLAAVVGLLAPRVAARPVAVGAVAAVAVGFAAVKTSENGARAASVAWSMVYDPSLVRADGTDLLALPALGLAWLAWRAARRRPAPTRGVRAARVAVLLPVALIGVAATSVAFLPNATAVGVDDGALVARVDDVGGIGHEWLRSRDGGTQWEVDVENRERLDVQVPAAGRSTSCWAAEPRRCYRVVADRLAVQESADAGATWLTAWSVPQEQRLRLARTFSRLDDPDRDLVSRALVVHDVPDGNHVVLVANGRDGFVIRHPDGRWERIGFPAGSGTRVGDMVDPAAVTPADRGRDILLTLATIAVAALLTVLVGGVAAGRRAGAGNAGRRVLAGAALLPAALVAVPWFTSDGFLFPVPFLPLAVGTACVIAAVLASVAIIVATVGCLRWRWTGELALAVALTVGLGWLAGAGWLWGPILTAPLALLLVGCAALPGMAVAVAAGRLVLRRTDRIPPVSPPHQPAPTPPGATG